MICLYLLTIYWNNLLSNKAYLSTNILPPKKFTNIYFANILQFIKYIKSYIISIQGTLFSYR